MAFFQRFWVDLKDNIIAFMNEFHSKGKLSKNLGASFIALIPKKPSADCTKDLRPIVSLEAPTNSSQSSSWETSKNLTSNHLPLSKELLFMVGKFLMCVCSRHRNRAGIVMQVRPWKKHSTGLIGAACEEWSSVLSVESRFMNVFQLISPSSLMDLQKASSQL